MPGRYNGARGLSRPLPRAAPRDANIRSWAAGSPYAAFQRAMKARNVTPALAEARDLPKLNLADSLALLVLIAEKEPRLYERAAVRWAGRFLLEQRPSLGDAVLVVTALGAANDRRADALAFVAALIDDGR